MVAPNTAVTHALVRFLGYGPRNPTVLFLGTEESNGSGGTQAICVRNTQFQDVEDLRSACRLLSQDRTFVDPFARPTNHVAQWNAAAKLRLALAGLPWEGRISCADRCGSGWEHYWRNHLGAAYGDTFLMECFPVPRAGTHVWIPNYDPRAEWPLARRAALAAFTSTIEPVYVVAYGNDARDRVHELFPVVPSWRDSVHRTWHSIAAPSGKASTAGVTARGTVVLRVPFFGQGLFAARDIPALVDAAWKLGTGAAPLTHPWPPPRF